MAKLTFKVQVEGATEVTAEITVSDNRIWDEVSLAEFRRCISEQYDVPQSCVVLEASQ